MPTAEQIVEGMRVGNTNFTMIVDGWPEAIDGVKGVPINRAILALVCSNGGTAAQGKAPRCHAAYKLEQLAKKHT